MNNRLGGRHPFRCGGELRAALLILVLSASACAPQLKSTAPGGSPSRQQLAEFWVEPGEARDLFHGPWGARYAPSPDVVYKLKKRETKGFSPKVDVVDPSGREWSVKMGTEAQSEVTSSRIVWALGYHQPPSYYLSNWKIEDEAGVRQMGPGRFRPELEQLDDKGPWSWYQNPFVGTRPYQGLLVLMMILNSTDLKGDNNQLYELREPREGARRWYTVKDLGASLGQTGRFAPKRNDIDEFEQQPFIEGMRGEYVRFTFHGRHQPLLRKLTPVDVAWVCRRLQRLTPEQWRDAFRAGGYDAATTARYVRRIQQKIAEGLALSEGR